MLKGPVGMILAANAVMLLPSLVSDKLFSWALWGTLLILALGFVAHKLNLTKELECEPIKEEWYTPN